MTIGTKKASVSIPEELYDDAESCASELKISRSRLYALALAQFLLMHNQSWITERMNEAHSTHGDEDDSTLRERTRAYHRRLLEGGWK